MTTAGEPCLDLIFRNARSHSAWLDKPVSDERLQELYDTMKWGPTSANANPARFVFIRTKAGKERLRPTLAPGNVAKTMAAPVTVIVKSNFLINLGYGDPSKLQPRHPRLAFEEACTLV